MPEFTQTRERAVRPSLAVLAARREKSRRNGPGLQQGRPGGGSQSISASKSSIRRSRRALLERAVV